MIQKIFVEKLPPFATEAKNFLADVKNTLGITIKNLRIINFYEAENISELDFEKCIFGIFSENVLDKTYANFDDVTSIFVDGRRLPSGAKCFAVRSLPGQFDQRADSAEQCAAMLCGIERPTVVYTKIYIFEGVGDENLERIKKYAINPVESEEIPMSELFAKKNTLKREYSEPENIKILDGFREYSEEELSKFIKEYSLAMDEEDIKFAQDYFKTENRDPFETEIRLIDTYWSDHCRHTTFNTIIDDVNFGENDEIKDAYEEYLEGKKILGREEKPVTLMDIALAAMRENKAEGLLPNLDESDEINACSVKIPVDNLETGTEKQWLLQFKNETHNHPTEIEPFGGAATCLGGAIRDPLAGRAFVYQAMRVTGAGNILAPFSETLPNKLSQRKISTTAAHGYSSYGNQIGLATGLVDEIYHAGYTAKRLEIGAVIGAVPLENVRREEPSKGDKVILLGGKTGRDGCGGATGSSKSHTGGSLAECGAEVQKGNPPEERKIQRLFRQKEVTLLIKRCNDFGAGGVSVAVGELADGLEIDLDKVPKKYNGLNGTELAISESQERMAVVVEAKNAKKFIEYAAKENLEATVIAQVTEDAKMIMNFRGQKIVNLSREFLNSNGAQRHTVLNFKEGNINQTSKLQYTAPRGLSEMFDATVGGGAVTVFDDKSESKEKVMISKLPVKGGQTTTVSLMTYSFDPYSAEINPFKAAYNAVYDSVKRLENCGAKRENIYLTFQEYFPHGDFENCLASLLGAYKAQKELGVSAIGGKDSMSGTYKGKDKDGNDIEIKVPPTLVSFAVAHSKLDELNFSYICGKNLLDEVYPTLTEKYASPAIFTAASKENSPTEKVIKHANGIAAPKVLIPVFPGTNGEYDMADSFDNVGGKSEFSVIRNLTLDWLKESAEEFEKQLQTSQILAFPGGFSAGDEPEGSAKFIVSFLRGERVKNAVHSFLGKGGLILGICNGFQALIKSGLLPYGKITDESDYNITFNTIGRHRHKFVDTRIASTNSPWLSKCNVGDIFTIPISHGEGRFVNLNESTPNLFKKGLVAAQYVDKFGNPTLDSDCNPAQSEYAIEALLSPGGHILGKMGHSERMFAGCAANVHGNKFMPIFRSGVEFFE